MSKAKIAQIAVEMGEKARRPKAWGKRNANNRNCPRCGKKTEIKGARYCCFCGADIRSKRDILIEKLQNVVGFTPHLPDNMCEEAQATLLEAIKVLSADA